MTQRFAVLGSPVAHSLSPRIHRLFAEQFDIRLDYRAIDTAARGFEATFAEFVAGGGMGANVTAPDKGAAYAFCARSSHRAQRAGSVNTLMLRNGEWHGETTDGSGLLRDLRQRHGFEVHDARVLLLGAGGAASAVAPALLDGAVGQLVIANRTRARAYDLIDRCGDADNVRVCTPDELPNQGRFDLVLHALAPSSPTDCAEWSPSIVDADSLFVDLNYGLRAMPALAWASKQGVTRLADGLGMLVEQAADSFELWHGVRPDTGSVYLKARNE